MNTDTSLLQVNLQSLEQLTAVIAGVDLTTQQAERINVIINKLRMCIPKQQNLNSKDWREAISVVSEALADRRDPSDLLRDLDVWAGVI